MDTIHKQESFHLITAMLCKPQRNQTTTGTTNKQADFSSHWLSNESWDY
jgi:hypothetical protein